MAHRSGGKGAREGREAPLQAARPLFRKRAAGAWSASLTAGTCHLAVECWKNARTRAFRAAASDTICRYYLIHYLQKFHQEFPDVRIKVTNSTSIGCAELLEKGQVDLIVCNSPNSRLGNHMNVKVLRDFRDIFVGNPDCFSPEEIPCELKTLLKQPILMLSSKSTTSEYLHQMFATHGLNLLPEVELNSNDLLMDLARIGLGIACIPDYMLNPDDSLKPIPLADPLPPRQLVLVQHDSLPLSQAAERFLDMFS